MTLDEKTLSGLGRAELLGLVRSLHGELKEIDNLLFDYDDDVEHQIDCHEITLPEYTRQLAATLKKIDHVGDKRREAEMDAIEKRAEAKPPDVIV